MAELIKQDDAQRNEVALKRDAYMEALTETYSDTYSAWLAKQSAEKRKRIAHKSYAAKHGLSTVAVLNCLGPKKCPFFHACPIPENIAKPGPDSDYPINMPCVLELEYVANQVQAYMKQLQVDPDDVVEMSLVNELALLDLLKNRAILVLAGGDLKGHGRDMLSLDEVISYDSNGNARVNSTVKEHPAIGIMERHEKRRGKILDKFVATRESKFKLYGGNLDNNTKLLSEMNQLRKHMENLSKYGGALNAEDAVEIDPKLVSLIGEVNEAF